MKLLLTLLCTSLYLTTLAQEKKVDQLSNQESKILPDTTIYSFTKVKNMPKYRGGMKRFYEDINYYLVYPKEAEKAGIKGRVFLSFIVELDGSISNIKVLKKLGYGCEEAAVNALQKTSFKEPAYHDGKPVRISLNIPVNFNIQSPQLSTPTIPGNTPKRRMGY